MGLDDTLPPDLTTASAEARAPRVGDLLAGRYRLDSELGSGGQATVFEASDLELGRTVAIKAIDARAGSDDSEGWRALLDEARLQADVDHEGVARLLDAVRDGERRYLAMELVRGPTLKEVLTRLRASRGDARPTGDAFVAALGDGATATATGPWDRVVAQLGERLAAGVAAMHARGVVHRDLKPGNVVLTVDGRPVVLDFGLAGRLGDEGPAGLAGTPGYLAPEQASESGSAHDPRVDVYALGLMLYELATLERAYPRVDVADLSDYLVELVEGRVQPAREVERRIDAGLDAVIGRALERDPDRRYPSLAPLREDLARVAAGRAPRHVATPAGYRARRALAVGARDARVLGAVAALVLAVIGWQVRASLETEVLALEAWRFRPGDGRLATLGDGSPIRVGDDLGLRVRGSEPGVVYALSIFGGDARGEQHVLPLRPVELVDGVPGESSSDAWGLPVEAGERDLVCARVEAHPREGLLAIVAPERSPELERWFASLETTLFMDPDAPGVPAVQAFGLLDLALAPSGPRGRPLGDGADLGARYRSLSAAAVAGDEPWDPGLGLERFEALFPVALP